MKIHIFGASGSGVTTLGETLAKELMVPYFDTDDYYWKKTDPPFTEKVEIADRQVNILRDTSPHLGWILGGSLISWGDFIKNSFNLVVFLYVPPEVRLERLMKREHERYGAVIFKDPVRKKQYLDFIDWATQYDNDSFHGRSRKNHLKWMDGLDCQKLIIEGNTTIPERVNSCMGKVSEMLTNS